MGRTMLIILFLFLVFNVTFGRRGLTGKRGNLNPYYDDDSGSNNTNNSISCNREKLFIEFDNECANDYDEIKKAYKNLLKNTKDCLYQDKHKHKNNIYYINKTDSYHGYVWVKESGCEDDLNISYDDYCIEEFDYEPVFTLNVGCTSESPYVGSTYLWHTDRIDASTDTEYNYVSSGNNYIDLFILDSGVLSTHDEFEDTTVIHLDSDWGDSSLLDSHGTHVAGIAGGENTGVFKHASHIYSYGVCRIWTAKGVACAFQNIEDGLVATISKLSENPSRRGVINLSFGGKGSSTQRDWYESYFTQMIDNGGIPVSAAGNDGNKSCADDDDGHFYVPNSADNCISVGSYTSSWSVSSFSNYGRCVDVYGPGSSIYSGLYDGTYYSITFTFVFFARANSYPHTSTVYIYICSIFVGVAKY